MLVKSIAARFVFISLVAVFLITVIASMNNSFAREFAYDLSRTTELVRISEVNAVTFEGLAGLKSGNVVAKVSGYSEIVSAVSNKFHVYEDGIKAVLIDAEYTAVYKNRILAGHFPDARAIMRGEACAVISDLLAVKLFKSIDIIDNEINVFGRKYTVTGVYKSRGSILWNLCWDGIDRIFVPYSSVESYKEKAVDVIALLEKPGQNAIDIKKILETESGNKISSYNIIEHSVTSVVIRQYFDLFLFVVGVLGILFTLFFSAKYFINTVRYLKRKTDSYYVMTIIKTETKLILRSLFVFLLCGIGIVVLIKTIQFKFIIADAFIPDDNIFDVQFYFRAVINEVRNLDAYTSGIYSILTYYYRNILLLELLCNSLVIILTVFALMLYKLLLFSGMTSSSLIKRGEVVMFVGGAAGVFASYLLGAGTYLPFKAYIVLAYYPVIVYYLFINKDKIPTKAQ